MNTFKKTVTHATVLATLLLVPLASQAQNTATGSQALLYNTTGIDNTADGYQALFSNTKGNDNSAVGVYALWSNTTGSYNTANGVDALTTNTTGSYNSATGYVALAFNTTGQYNTANGMNALYHNSTGGYNTANGVSSLYSNTIGQYNTANGLGALFSNTTASYNTANGYEALYSNTTSEYNTATGYEALYSNTTGQYNTADGLGALYSNKTGNNNIAEGYYALFQATGSSNIALGSGAGNVITTGSNNIVIGNQGVASDNGIIRIGTNGTQTQAYIAGITGEGVTGAAVYVTSTGQLGILKSSARFKYDIQDMGVKSDKLMDLRPVTFRYKDASEDGTHPQQYGLIAEEVAKVYPDLVQYDKAGKPFTVYYHLLTPIMLNELQKLHHQVDAQQTEISSLKAGLQNQGATLKSQSAGMASLQRTVQTLLLVGAALILVALVGAASLLSTRTHRLPSLRMQPTAS